MPMISRVVVALLLVPLWVHSQSAASDAEWKQFITWVQATSPESFNNPAAIVSGYKTKLLRDGVPAVEADQLVARLEARRQNNPEWISLHFNRLYTSKDRPQKPPNAFLVDTVSRLKPGRALDLGMGEGRNTLYLAQRGWDVTGVDLSETGVTQAKQRAAALGLRINALVENVERFDFGTDKWDLVCFLYFGDRGMPDLSKRVVKGLKPGGYVIFELPAPMVGLRALWDHWEPLGLKLLHLEYHAGESDWGGRNVSRLLLQKSQ